VHRTRLWWLVFLHREWLWIPLWRHFDKRSSCDFIVPIHSNCLVVTAYRMGGRWALSIVCLSQSKSLSCPEPTWMQPFVWHLTVLLTEFKWWFKFAFRRPHSVSKHWGRHQVQRNFVCKWLWTPMWCQFDRWSSCDQLAPNQAQQICLWVTMDTYVTSVRLVVILWPDSTDSQQLFSS